MLKCVDVTDGLGRWSDASKGHRDVPGIRNDTNIAANAQATVSVDSPDPKLLNLPTGSTMGHAGLLDGLEGHVNMPSMHR